MGIQHQQKQIFFTIIIPTRERSDTLVRTLETALSQDYDQFKVLVSDNASDDDTQEKVISINDPRLKYVNTGRRVSMSENWEFALSHVENGWITVLGDDDALLPGTLRKVNDIIIRTGTSAIRSNGCSYFWPGFNDTNYGELNISLERGYEIRDSGQMLQQVLDGFRAHDELPMLYNGGFISIDLIKRAKLVTERFFMSMNPDVYSAIVLSFLTDSYIYSREPLAINGASLHSNGTAGFERVKRERSYNPTDKFWSEKNIPIHEDIPLLENGRLVRSTQITIYEAYLQAQKFHLCKKVSTNHAKQLYLAIKNSGPDQSEILVWAKLFARKNRLSLPILSFFSCVPKSFDKIFNRLRNMRYIYRVKGSRVNPLWTVADASVVAGALKQIRPSVYSRVVNRILYRITNV
jgi:glycosyltransferase involved in cell wall biosynthesis